MSNFIKKLASSFSTEVLEETARRFWLPLSQIVILALVLCLSVNDYGWTGEHWWQVVTFYCAVGWVLSFSLQLWGERDESSSRRIGTKILLQLLWLANAAYLYFVSELTVPVFISNLSLSVLIGISLLVLPFLKEKNELPFWNFTLRILFLLLTSSLIAGVLSAAVSFLMFMLEMLFEVYVNAKLYGYTIVFCNVLFAAILFFTRVPKKEHIVDPFPRVFKILNFFARWILMPVFVVYSIVLYAFGLKILFTWTLPIGWVSCPVSILFGGMIVVIFLIYPARISGKGTKADELFCRWAPLAILPLLFLMSVGIFYRLNQYGITTMRLYLCLFNLWCYGTVIYLLTKQSLRLMFPLMAFGILFFVTSIGPWSFESLTVNAFEKWVMEVAEESKPKPVFPLDEKGYQKWMNSLSQKEQAEVSERLLYLRWNTSKMAARFVKDEADISFYDYIYSAEEDTVVHSIELKNGTEGFVAIPAGFSQMITGDNGYVYWDQEDMQRGKKEIELYVSSSEKVSIVLSLQQLKELNKLLEKSPQFLPTKNPNVTFYLTELDYAINEENGKVVSASGFLKGYLLKK